MQLSWSWVCTGEAPKAGAVNDALESPVDFADHRFQGPAPGESNSWAPWLVDESELLKTNQVILRLMVFGTMLRTINGASKRASSSSWGKVVLGREAWSRTSWGGLTNARVLTKWRWRGDRITHKIIWKRWVNQWELHSMFNCINFLNISELEIIVLVGTISCRMQKANYFSPKCLNENFQTSLLKNLTVNTDIHVPTT